MKTKRSHRPASKRSDNHSTACERTSLNPAVVPRRSVLWALLEGAFGAASYNRVRSSDLSSLTGVPLCKTPSIARSLQATVES